MDTKSRRWKRIISFAAFFLGITLLIAVAADVAGAAADQGSLKGGFTKAFTDDYQDTQEFRYAMAGYLENFLMMATGGPLAWHGINGGAYNFSYEYNVSAWEADSLETAEVSIVEAETAAAAETAVAEEGETTFEGDGDPDTVYYSISGGNGTPGENRRAAKRMHDYIKEDKNLLYRVVCDGDVLYENMEGPFEVAEGEIPALPEGYNFLLYFDGSSVRIIKDGVEQDVYGDGYYTEDKSWYVPGYRNFPADEGMSGVRIYMLAAEKPALYIRSAGDTGGYQEQNGDGLYLLERRLEETAGRGRGWVVSLIAAAVCLAVYVLFRPYKREADRAIAAGTGRIWFELKLTVAVIFGAGFLYQCWDLFSYGYWMLREEGLSFRSMAREFGGGYLLESIGFVAVPVFWCLYLLCNDLVYNRQSWKNSLLSRVYRGLTAMSTEGLQMPFQKKMVRRYRAVFAASMALAAVAVILLFMVVLYEDIYYESAGIVLVAVTFLILSLSVWASFRFARDNRRLSQDMGALVDQIEAVRSGNLADKLECPDDSLLAGASASLNDIQRGMDSALEEKIKSERMKVELISNVSHDIKTPLTSIISYVDLLKKEEDLPDYVKDYIRILDGKSQRLKTMVQDVFEVSKAASGQLPVDMERIDFGKLLRQTLADMEEQIASSSIGLKTQIPEEPILVNADGKRLYRVFQNLIQNALKYSLEGSRLYVTLNRDATMAVASVRNTSRDEIPAGLDLTERFVRADEARTDGGSGLGLSIARSFTEACGGSFSVESVADLFTVSVTLPVAD